MSFKCTPDEFDELTEIDGITQAPYCAKRLWVRVGDLLALPAPELERVAFGGATIWSSRSCRRKRKRP